MAGSRLRPGCRRRVGCLHGAFPNTLRRRRDLSLSADDGDSWVRCAGTAGRRQRRDGNHGRSPRWDRRYQSSRRNESCRSNRAQQ